MNTRLSPPRADLRIAFFGLVVLAVVLAGCSASNAAPPTAPAPAAATVAPPAPTVAPAAPTTAVEPTAASAPAAAAAGTTVMVTKNDQLGSFLADDQGRTLYLFTKDTPNTSNCYDKCAQAWPPLLTQGAAKAGDGVDASLLGTTTRKDGSMQVTYNGWPLYYFAKDQKPGDVTGQDVGGVWYVISPKGDKVEAAESSSSGASGQAASQTVNIAVQNFSFNPKELTISVGTTVVWHNNDSVMHTVTSDTGLFDGNLPPGGADFQFTFSQAGTYPYYCKPHGGPGGQGMSGVITVK
jgi:predicted lipoprotein with Yx(FWY)xxD motif/plastocyanin